MSASLNAIQNFYQLDDQIATAGQPFADQLLLIRDAGYKIVINLAMPDSLDAIPDEERQVKELGLDYYHIPVKWELPLVSDFEQFCDLMSRLDGKKLFIHCARNKRVSVFMMLYRHIKLRLPLEECRVDVSKIWEPDPTWQEFIDEVLEAQWPVGES